MNAKNTLSAALLALASTQIWAQGLPPRVEVGVHFATINEEGLGEKPLGGGGGITYRLSRYFAVDGEANRYPIGGGAPNFPFTQVLIGARAGIRIGNVGLFGKIRPGLGLYDNTQYQPGIGTKTNLDIGGILEYYFAWHIGARIDFVDAIVFWGSNPIGSPTGPKTLGTRNQLQGNFGVFVHF